MSNQSLKLRERLRSERGMSLILILAALLVMGVLYAGYFNLSDSESTMSKGGAVKSASQAMSCGMNRRSIEQGMMRWSITHPDEQATIERLERDGILVKRCPDGGQLTIEGKKVLCSVHSD
jgi:competence protein ComGC